MKKILLVMAILIFGLTGCNNSGNQDNQKDNQTVKINSSYDMAIIQLANGEVIETEIKNWKLFDDGKLQITSTNGTVYLTSSTRCDLIKIADNLESDDTVQDILSTIEN